MVEYVVETEGLVKIYRDRSGEVKALDGVDMKVPQGVMFGLFGPNGSGKTTLISILVGLQLPTSGTARVLGFDCIRESIEIRKRLGLLPENYGFYEYMTAYENLEYFGRLDGIAENELKQKIREVLEIVGLNEWANAKVKGFSRGMTQRLALAQALLKDPLLLILDEPTLGLDPQGTAMFKDLMEKLVKNGKTVLISTHLLHEIGHICTHAALIRKGKLIAHGSLDELSKPYIEAKGFLYEVTASSEVERLFQEVKQLDSILEVSLVNDKIRIRAKKDVSDELSRLASMFRVKSLTSLPPSWDELYRYYQGGGWE
ncbi:MAG: ABC transporter ATP-binding protein [Thermofilaceae archaeon]